MRRTANEAGPRKPTAWAHGSPKASTASSTSVYQWHWGRVAPPENSSDASLKSRGAVPLSQSSLSDQVRSTQASQLGARPPQVQYMPRQYSAFDQKQQSNGGLTTPPLTPSSTSIPHLYGGPNAFAPRRNQSSIHTQGSQGEWLRARELARAASVPTTSAKAKNRAHAAALGKLITLNLEADQRRGRAGEDGKADEVQEGSKAMGAPAPPSLVQVASGLVAPQYSVNFQLPDVSLADFCQHYGINSTDQERLEKLEFQPGDAIDTLPEDDWKIFAGFTTLSWRRILAKNNSFICDAQGGLWG